MSAAKSLILKEIEVELPERQHVYTSRRNEMDPNKTIPTTPPAGRST